MLEAELLTYSLGLIFLNRNFSATWSPLFYLCVAIFLLFYLSRIFSLEKSHQHVEDLPKQTTKLLNTQAIKVQLDFF